MEEAQTVKNSSIATSGTYKEVTNKVAGTVDAAQNWVHCFLTQPDKVNKALDALLDGLSVVISQAAWGSNSRSKGSEGHSK